MENQYDSLSLIWREDIASKGLKSSDYNEDFDIFQVYLCSSKQHENELFSNNQNLAPDQRRFSISTIPNHYH